MNVITLRPYQEECVKKVNSLPEGTRTIVCLATGLGKTVTAANFKSTGRVLWLSHRDELVRQPEKYFKMLGRSYGIEKAENTSDGEDVVSASVQTLSRDNRLKKFSPDDFEIVICDEAQHAAAETYKKVLGYFRPKKLIGLTATPKRGDNVRLTDVFDDICFTRDLKWGIENGYLSRIRCVRVSAEFDYKNIKTSMGDLAVSSMQKEMLSSDDDIVVAKAYMEYCLPEKKKTLIYCPTIKVCQKVYDTMAGMIKEEDMRKVKLLSDKTPAKDRADILKSYDETENVNCIINCMILTEGTDLPGTSVIINNRPTANATLYQQIVGRGTRLAEGKDYCLIIDVVGKNCMSRNLCTAPTLFGLDPDVLPDSIQNRLYGEDLLEATEDLLENRADRAKSIELHKELIDIFTGQRLKIIDENRSKGLGEVAHAYEKTLENNGSRYDFKDLIVKTTPEDDKYYCIPATYNGNIYISKPDMLGKSFITVDIPEKETLTGKRWRGTSNPMPTEAAIETVITITENGLHEKYKCRWSKKARENMQKVNATDNQTGYVETLYKEKIKKKLTKLEASDLIDLINEIKEMQQKSSEYGRMMVVAADNENAMKKKRNYRQELKDRNERLERMRIMEKEIAHKDYREIIQNCIKEKQKREDFYQNLLENKEKREINILVPAKFCGYHTRRASEKQISYARGMFSELKERGYRFEDDPIPDDTDMYRINFIIELLKRLQSFPILPEGYECYIKDRDFLSSLRSLDPTKYTDATVKCICVIRNESPEMEELPV